MKHILKPVISLCLILFSTLAIAQPPRVLDLSVQKVVLPDFPAQLDFAGEPVPLQNFEVRESLQRDLTVLCYWHSSMIYTIQLAHRYFPIIEPILKEQGIPDDFKYLCVAESNLQNVVSPAKAAGFWQILSGTGKQYGLEITPEVDERYHLENATLAACKYLKDAYKRFGNWTLAAASYNVGMGHVSMQLKNQKADSYYDLALNEETSRYVHRSLGFKLIMENPGKYGFAISPEKLFPVLRFEEVSVKTPIASLTDFAIEHGTSYKMIKYFNPWLRDTKLLNKAGKTYKIKVPEKDFRQTAY